MHMIYVSFLTMASPVCREHIWTSQVYHHFWDFICLCPMLWSVSVLHKRYHIIYFLPFYMRKNNLPNFRFFHLKQYVWLSMLDSIKNIFFIALFGNIKLSFSHKQRDYTRSIYNNIVVICSNIHLLTWIKFFSSCLHKKRLIYLHNRNMKSFGKNIFLNYQKLNVLFRLNNISF